MIPKEKAIDLVLKFQEAENVFNLYDNKAKQCAMICVDDRLNEINEYLEYLQGCYVLNVTMWNHYLGKQREWQEVKSEIKKL